VEKPQEGLCIKQNKMKKKVITALSLSFLIISCDKQEVANIEKKSTTNGVKLVSFEGKRSDVGTTNNFTMLAFDNWKEFEEKASELDQIVELYDDNFVNQWSDLSDEELDEKEIELKFDNQLPLADFEKSIGLTNSLRKVFNTENEAYLSQEILDPAKDPNTKYLFDGGELSLLNSQQQVMIGKDIYQFDSKGYQIIKSDYATTLSAIKTNPDLISSNITKFKASEFKNDCTKWKANGIWDEFQPGVRGVSLICKIRSLPIWTKTESMSISYYKGRRRWRESRIHQRVFNNAYLFDNSCGNLQNQGVTGFNTYKKKKRRDNKQNIWGGDRLGAKQNVSVRGGYHFDGNYNKYALVW
jgi:hypothetical protein